MRIRFNATMREGHSRVTATTTKTGQVRIHVAVGKADLKKVADTALERILPRKSS